MAALLGLMTALSWGTADFSARFTSRALGAMMSALGASAVSMTLMTAAWLWIGAPMSSGWLVVALSAASGLATAAALTLLYQGLRLGTVALAVTLASTYPVWALVIGVVFQGVRPDPLAWAAMALTLFGVWIVSAVDPHGGADEGPEEVQDDAEPAAPRRGSLILIGLASGLCFALALKFAQPAVDGLGQITALWVARIASTVVLFAMLVLSGRGVTNPGRWTPVLILQGALDASGYLALLSVTSGVAAEVATVVSSAVGVVTILLAHFILREPIGRAQWGGIALTFIGVASLTALGGAAH
ncbi:DMT family transporter [Caenispirillum salinarum]|uniref:DMT family transporter n=1 Tax=Caenispirillum salinarum TaxID=859058 RepID=UPI00384C74DA